MGKMKTIFLKSWKKILTNLILVLFGIFCLAFWPNLWNDIVDKQLTIRPGNLIHKFWMNPPQPLYLDTYFFNWTNPHDFLNKSTKPIFKEIGPYRFQEFPQKVNVSFHDHNETVSYRKQSRYIFMPEQSKGKLTDVISSVNVIALSAANQARTMNLFKTKGIELSLRFFGQEIHTVKTASELLFEGYDDPIITVAKDIASLMGIDVPFDRFGWFYKRNESSLLTGHFNADTSSAKLGQLEKWNYDSEASFFDSECSNLAGASAGELFPPEITKNPTISLFSPEMCRNVVMDYERDTKVHGVDGKRFIGGDRTVDNGTIYPENKCFCSGECVMSGVLNVTACRLGAPVFMSFPHFFNADPYYVNEITGMTPNKEKHQFFMTLESRTSLPLEIAGRFQLNVLMKSIPNINMYRNVPQKKFLPVVWFEQHFKINYKQAIIIKLIVEAPLIGRCFGILLAFIGIYNIFMTIFRKDNKADEFNIIEKEKENQINQINNNNHNHNNNNNNISSTKRLPEHTPLMS